MHLRWTGGVAVAALLYATCSGSIATLAAPTTSSWLEYHLDAARSGDDTAEPSFVGMTSAWTTGPLDGQIYAEPLVADNLVIVATERNSVYAFNARSGARVWHINLGAPRTSNFPCGDIMPLGITGTPVIDRGHLYVVAEMANVTWRLARINPVNGAIAYSVGITPSGMPSNNEQERSALAVSDGNVVIAWGGLDGDCGNYHGYLETVSESTGHALHQWNDTQADNEGGMWAPSGPAVDSAGNIYVSTGNGSSTTTYDYGDSVVRLSPALQLQSYFAPGPPQSWAQNNGNDTDLGSIGPSLLPDGRLFAIGKGGRGYLLDPERLPSDPNPGNRDNPGAPVCASTSSAAFSGLAVSGSTVFVPCADGVNAVSIDSTTSFHTVWHSSSGGSAPIVAGGLVWTVPMFGGSTLYGLSGSSGDVVERLALPASTVHFATPAAALGHLFIGAGDRVAAFASARPPASPSASTGIPPSAAATGLSAIPGGGAGLAVILLVLAGGAGAGFALWRRRTAPPVSR